MSVTAVPLRPLRKGSVLKLWIALGFLMLIAAGVAWASTEQLRAMDPNVRLAQVSAREGVVTTESGLRFETVRPGTGERPGTDDLVLVEYTGRLSDGTVFDSSEGRGPAVFPVAGMIPGFTEALQMMQAGGQYRLWLPPELAYGEQGSGPIPPNSVLEFEVTLLDVAPGAALQMQGPGGPGGE